MSFNSDEDRQLLELNHRSWEGEGKRGNNGVEDEERRLVEDDDSKSNGRAGDVKGRQGGAVQAQTVTQQPQGSTVCWERFLHLRSLKVLLVEYDDCTRHIVTALLRNCSYEVIPVANGVQAWKILEDLTNHVDLVLTEVVMPCVSGVGLLSKIMSHKTRKNVPVIMMSSHDSMGLVFKCLSKGAVDFLVKPIRKNELKNLWQHIWRRCHSSSGSGTGSESGTQTQRSIRSKSVEKSENSSGSNDGEDNVNIDLNIGDGSDNGSGTQSSWTKKAVEVDSPRHAYSWPHPDSTCAQVVHSNAESFDNKLLPAAATRECQQQKEQNDNFAMGKDLEIGLTNTKDLQHGQRNDFSTKLAGTRQNIMLETGSSKLEEKIDKGKLNLNHESPSSMLKYDVATITGVTNPTDSQMGNTQFEASNRHYNVLDVNNKANSNTHELPSVELSLKRLRGVKGTETTVQDDRNVLRRSDSSAFSRYNAALNANKGPSGHVGSNSPHDNSGEVTKKEFFCEIRSHSRDNPPNQCSIGGSNINDMGSTTNNAVSKSQVANKSAAAASRVQLLHPSSAFYPVKDLKSATEHVIVDNANNVETTIRVQSRDTQKLLQIQNLHQDYDQNRVHHHVVHNMQEQQLRDDNDLSLKKLAVAAPHRGSSNALTGTVEGNPGNYSINGSGSGSNHGSNGQNGGSGGHNVGGRNLESDYGVAGKSGSGEGSGNQSGNRVDENKFKQREAALTKFRQKRKERCFRKKVRYQNRKNLADQRPRIRGQFVRQTVSENTSRTTEV